MKANSLKIEAGIANTLARSYSPLLYFRKLKELVESVCEGVDCSSFDKYDFHNHINKVLCASYAGEEIIKYRIAKKYLKKDTVGAFELNVKNSRADFVSINGVTRCYEIKTNLDNLGKLKKQAEDYSSVFEYNSVLLDKKHLQQAMHLLPMQYGIFSIELGSLKCLRAAKKNDALCSRSQLEMLTSRELNIHFGHTKEDLEIRLGRFSAVKINNEFKKALKLRYAERWNFVKKHQDIILPIDFQFFFSTKESPSLLYQKRF